ncbi:energy transducer TonB [Cytophagaceae bacterium YF14B1]|uniref:Energy transducer TonB n=1 Tax=Xanthocytophaga flava TaxID=3048013 RepID=A0AAE3U5C8_9BACT|nr:energy transducer TonB [Xanthocytophaga flavus]MDJ1480644.1 energy transducer TonB [Xanthocytophaga flavus]
MKPVFLLICMLLSVSLVFGQLEKETNSEGQKSNDSYGPIDEMPEFWGGQKALHKFISSTLRYPEKALKNKVSGVVYVSFMVKSSGYIEKILRLAKGLTKIVIKKPFVY